MISRLASKYIKEIKFDTREKRDEIRRAVRFMFLDFCEENGVESTLETYREYRSVVRAVFGFDLVIARPQKKAKILETSLELF